LRTSHRTWRSLCGTCCTGARLVCTRGCRAPRSRSG
jgi:hypothetical protein